VLGQKPLVFVLVAVGAEQLPVAAVWWVVFVIVVPMVYFEKLKVGVSELAPASSADPRVHLQRLLAIALSSFLSCTSRLRDYTVEAAATRRGFGL